MWHYAYEGYLDKRRDLEKMLRNVAWVTYRVNGGTYSDASQLWPIAGEKSDGVNHVLGDTPEEAKAMFDRIMAIHNIPVNSDN